MVGSHSQTSINTEKLEIKIGLLKILYANSFVGLDHEDLYTNFTKFYKLYGTLEAPEEEEEKMFKWLFPHYLIGKAKKWYMDHLYR